MMVEIPEIRTTVEIMRLADERSCAMDLAAAAGRFLARPWDTDRMLPLKELAEQTLDAAFDLIKDNTEKIRKLKEVV